jgi:hypothetical protein
MIAVDKIPLVLTHLEFFPTDDLVMERKFCVEKCNRREYHTVPEKMGKFLKNGIVAISI